MTVVEDEGFRQLRELQRAVAEALFRPLAPGDRMQALAADGQPMRRVAAEWIKPNDRLTSFDRLQIYNRCYWFRVLDSLYDDFPGLRAVLGSRRFHRLSKAYLARHPSVSFTLRDLGSRLETFMREEPQWAAPHQALALDMVRFEWAQIIAFDGPSRPPLPMDELLGADPAALQLGLQPYISLLALNHPVDKMALAIKARDADAINNQSSNAADGSSRLQKRAAALPRPRPENVRIAVHRHDNMLFFKRMEPDQFSLFMALQRGATVEEACGEAAGAHPGDGFAERVRSWFETAAALGWFCPWKEEASVS